MFVPFFAFPSFLPLELFIDEKKCVWFPVRFFLRWCFSKRALALEVIINQSLIGIISNGLFLPKKKTFCLLLVLPIPMQFYLIEKCCSKIKQASYYYYQLWHFIWSHIQFIYSTTHKTITVSERHFLIKAACVAVAVAISERALLPSIFPALLILPLLSAFAEKKRQKRSK